MYGFGEKKTPKAFVSACDKFIFTEVLRFQEDAGSAVKPKTANELKRDTKLVALLRSALEAASDESGWAHLGAVGSNIAKTGCRVLIFLTTASPSLESRHGHLTSLMWMKESSVTGILKQSTSATSARSPRNNLNHTKPM